MQVEERAQKSAVSRLARNDSGNVAMMWALMGAVLLGLVGMSVDFTRAQMLRSQMQNAADGAALVAERSANLPLSQRTIAARAFFDSEMGEQAQNVSFAVREIAEGGHEIDVSMPMPLSIARIVRAQDWIIRVDSVAQASASPPIEVAMVLDNTGSMANDMQSLRDAAHNLASDLLTLDGDTVKVALVPFVAQVNIGNQQSHMAWMDTAGAAPMNGELLEDRMIANRAAAGSVLKNCNGANYPAVPAGYTGPYRLTWSLNGSRCYAFTPGDGVNYFTLFDQISNDDWKGCVEARPEPYDITDEPPVVRNPASMFVPFFWLDTGGTAGQGSSNSQSAANYLSSNSYLDDTPGDISGATMSTGQSGTATAQQAREARFFNVFKYRGGSAAIDATAPDTRGPNRGCPTPIVPLTTDRNAVFTAISSMQSWNGGGTNQAEGLAWGWRVLSPSPPFTEGVAYGHDDTRKVIVLMSDGENTNVGNDPVVGSDYSAYNHMGFWRDVSGGNLLTQLLFGILHGILPAQYRRNINSSNQYVTYVNNREAQLCRNIKGTGIEIYTVIFRETDTDTENLMRSCATDNSHFYRANNATELAAAFRAIGTGIGQLRLTH